jgi:hypothetical protein
VAPNGYGRPGQILMRLSLYLVWCCRDDRLD